jgi:hypothetical protein
MSDIRKHKATQEAFAAHIRNPNKYPKPDGVEEQRMQIYRDLFFNNVNGLIKQAYPVLSDLYETEEWHNLIRDFYQKQNNKTPYFTEIATEFLHFLKERPIDSKRPFIGELAHYEWLEMELEKELQKPDYQAVDGQQLRDKVPIVTPLINLHSYQYPVHQISKDYQPKQSEGLHHLMVWRNRNHRINFAQLNDISKQLLTQLLKTQQCGEQAIVSVFKKNSLEVTEQTVDFGLQQLFKWHQQDIIIGIQ